LRCFLRAANNQKSGGIKSEIRAVRRVLKYILQTKVLYYHCSGNTMWGMVCPKTVIIKLCITILLCFSE
jgi:hypothetical protein